MGREQVLLFQDSIKPTNKAIVTPLEARLNALLAEPFPNERTYEEIGKCYQSIGKYEQAIRYLDLAYAELCKLFPNSHQIHNPYSQRKQVCKQQLEKLKSKDKKS